MIIPPLPSPRSICPRPLHSSHFSRTKKGSRAFLAFSARLVPTKLACSVFVTFLDKNPYALEYSKNLAKDLPKHFNLHWVEDTASSFPKYLDNKPDLNLVEMVGLLDYFDDEKVISVFSISFST